MADSGVNESIGVELDEERSARIMNRDTVIRDILQCFMCGNGLTQTMTCPNNHLLCGPCEETLVFKKCTQCSGAMGKLIIHYYMHWNANRFCFICNVGAILIPV